jgi:hypothetical protein
VTQSKKNIVFMWKLKYTTQFKEQNKNDRGTYTSKLSKNQEVRDPNQNQKSEKNSRAKLKLKLERKKKIKQR